MGEMKQSSIRGERFLDNMIQEYLSEELIFELKWSQPGKEQGELPTAKISSLSATVTALH